MKQKPTSHLKINLVKAAQLHLVFVLAYIAQIIVYDASKLFVPEIILQRWYAAAGLAAVAVAVWYLARSNFTDINSHRILTWLLILAGIAFAAFNIYTQRGMASKSVILFLIPVLTAAILLSRVAVFSTAILCIIAYTTTALAYFTYNFNEGYKVELYGETLFYSSVFLICAALLWLSTKTKRHTN